MRVPRRFRVLCYALSSAVGATALVGVLHLPVATPVLRLFAGLCPVNNVSADVVERMQASAAASLRGSVQVPRRDTLGLQILFGGRYALEAWVAESPSPCHRQSRGFDYVTCETVTPDAGERQLLASVDRAGRVRSVDLIGHPGSTASGAISAKAIADDLSQRLGPPHAQAGVFAAEYLALPFRAASSTYRFADVLITVSATNIPGSGVVVEERYVWPGPAATTESQVSGMHDLTDSES